MRVGDTPWSAEQAIQRSDLKEVVVYSADGPCKSVTIKNGTVCREELGQVKAHTIDYLQVSNDIVIIKKKCCVPELVASINWVIDAQPSWGR